MKTITLELGDEVAGLIQALDPHLTVEQIVLQILDHVQQGVYRPGAWEREWLSQVFPQDDWTGNLQPGDPYGRPGCEHCFVKPK